MDTFTIRAIGAAALALGAAQGARMAVRPSSRLSPRLGPYIATSRSALRHGPAPSSTGGVDTAATPRPLLVRLVLPLLHSLTASITKLLRPLFDDDALALRLRQAGTLADLDDADRVHEFRVRQVGSALAWGIGLAVLAASGGMSAAAALVMFAAGAAIGAVRRSTAISSRIEARRERMRVELYTVNQLLAIYLRTSGAPVMAAQRLVSRGHGAVIDDLAEALRLHTRGMSAARAFQHIAAQTPEPYAARTYKLLASGSERGADVAGALLALSDDVRESRRTSLRRSATRRQAATLVPIIAILAPVMLLFLLAPIPHLLFDALH